ncbi:MAG: DUF4229 domain-containing protein [Actinomycetota bacterium]
MTVLRYTLLRTMLLFGCMLTLYLVGVHDPLPLLGLTAVTSIVLSYFVLKGPREAMARTVAEHAARRLQHEPVDAFDEDAAVEDAEDDTRRTP